MWRIWWAPNNASRWQMGLNWVFKPYPANLENMVSFLMPADGRWDLTWRLTRILLTWRIWWASNNARRWYLTGCLTRILLTWRIWWAPNNASRWQMGFNWAFKGLRGGTCWKTADISSHLIPSVCKLQPADLKVFPFNL